MTPARQPLSLFGLRALLVLLVAGLAWAAGCAATPAHHPAAPHAARLAPGDLVFLDLHCALCEAIEAVTCRQFGVSGPALSHVGLIAGERDGQTLVIEAWPGSAPDAPGVIETPLSDVLARVSAAEGQAGGYRFLRLRPEQRQLGLQAVAAARRQLGAPYDELFLPDGQALYCAELVQLAFAKASPGDPPFLRYPMRFGEPGSAARAAWDGYYRARGQPIPQGQPGASPLSLYLDGRRSGLFIGADHGPR